MPSPVHIWDNQLLPSSVTQTFWSGGQITFGARFALSGSRTVYNLLWYYYTGDLIPQFLDLWSDTGTNLASVAVSGGTVGQWNTYALGTPVVLPAGTYRVSATFAGAGYWSYVNIGSLAAPPAGIAWAPAPRCYNSSGHSNPSIADTAAGPWLVDVALDDPDTVAPSPPAPATGGDLGGWLSSDPTTNSHQSDGLPWGTSGNLTTLKAEAEGVNGFAAIKAVADAIAAAVGGLAGTVAGAVTTITGQITASTADIFSHAVTGLTAISGNVASVENHALDVLAGMVTFPGSSPHFTWTAGDPISFDECVAVAVPAEAYHLEILSHPRHPLNQVCGVNLIYRSGWWCELSGEIGSERHYIDFEKTLLRAGNRRLSGCLVSLEPGFSGVLTPYTLETV